MSNDVCIVTGVGPGTGAALVRRFADGGFKVAMLARSADRLNELAAQTPNATALSLRRRRRSPTQDDARAHRKRPWPRERAHSQRRRRRVRRLHANRTCGLGAQLQDQRHGALPSRPRRRTRDDRRRPRRHHRDRKHIGLPRQSELRRLRADQSRATHPGRVARTQPRAEGHPRRLSRQSTPSSTCPGRASNTRTSPTTSSPSPAAIADVAWNIAHQDRSTWAFDIVVRPFGENW